MRDYLKKMQLDVDVSPPANIITFRLTFTYVTFDFDPLCRIRIDSIGWILF